MIPFKTALALEDIWETASWLGEREDPDLGIRFVDAVESTIASLLSDPELGPKVRLGNPRVRGVRFWRVNEFPNHLVFYKIEVDRVIVLRVLHGARNLEDII